MGEVTMRKRQMEALVDFAEKELRTHFFAPMEVRAALMDLGSRLALAVRLPGATPEQDRMDGLVVPLPPGAWFGSGIQAQVSKAALELRHRWPE